MSHTRAHTYTFHKPSVHPTTPSTGLPWPCVPAGNAAPGQRQLRRAWHVNLLAGSWFAGGTPCFGWAGRCQFVFIVGPLAFPVSPLSDPGFRSTYYVLPTTYYLLYVLPTTYYLPTTYSSHRRPSPSLPACRCVPPARGLGFQLPQLVAKGTRGTACC